MDEQLLKHLDGQRETLQQVYDGAGYDKLLSLKMQLKRNGFDADLGYLSKLLRTRYGINCSTGTTTVFKVSEQDTHRAVPLFPKNGKLHEGGGIHYK